jgi:hypothetical protein
LRLVAWGLMLAAWSSISWVLEAWSLGLGACSLLSSFIPFFPVIFFESH